MKLDKLVSGVGEWLKGKGADADIVISSRVRLARNLSNFIFLTNANEAQRSEVANYIQEKVKSARLSSSLVYIDLKELSDSDKEFLVERHLISRDHAKGNGPRAVAFDGRESWSIMVNEEDHLRIQVLRSGFQLGAAWEAINDIDNKLEKHLGYAFSPQFGYLTACPTNVGTGLRISVMLHLPALSMTKQIEKVFHTLVRIKYTVRGFYGEGTRASGDFYQISNQVSLGKSEKEVINEMQNVMPEIIRYERTWREKLLNEPSKKLSDRISRAYGILSYANAISSEETMELLSSVRLGVNLKLIRGLSINTINELFILSQPVHLQKIAKRSLKPDERDVFRAELIREKVKKD